MSEMLIRLKALIARGMSGGTYHLNMTYEIWNMEYGIWSMTYGIWSLTHLSYSLFTVHYSLFTLFTIYTIHRKLQLIVLHQHTFIHLVGKDALEHN